MHDGNIAPTLAGFGPLDGLLTELFPCILANPEQQEAKRDRNQPREAKLGILACNTLEAQFRVQFVGAGVGFRCHHIIPFV